MSESPTDTPDDPTKYVKAILALTYSERRTLVTYLIFTYLPPGVAKNPLLAVLTPVRLSVLFGADVIPGCAIGLPLASKRFNTSTMVLTLVATAKLPADPTETGGMVDVEPVVVPACAS